MGKKAKEHRKKVNARNAQIKSQQKQMEKARERFIMDLIEREKQAGLFDQANNDNTTVVSDGPTL